MLDKLIREGRMGPPKCWKTGSVVSTYPKPMLVLETDPEGISVVREPVVIIKPNDLAGWCAKKREELPPIICVDFAEPIVIAMNETYCPPSEGRGFSNFIMAVNNLGKACPWQTVVVDTTTSLQDMVYRHLSATNSGQLSDPRKWASSIGMKIKEVICRLATLPTHLVVLMHSTTDKSELTGVIKTEPMLYSQFRDQVGGVLSQFFYQEMQNGQPKLVTKDNGFIKGVGARWPANLPNPCGVTFKEVYETIYPNPK